MAKTPKPVRKAVKKMYKNVPSKTKSAMKKMGLKGSSVSGLSKELSRKGKLKDVFGRHSSPKSH